MATKLFLRNTTTNGITDSGDGVLYDMLPVAGASVDTDTVTLTDGGTQIQWTQSAGGSSIAWISGRVPSGGFTLTTTDISVWLLESNMNDEAEGRFRVFKYTPGTPTITELGGGPFDDGAELGTTITEMTWVGNVTDTAFAENDRILLRLYATNFTTMTAGTANLQFNAADASTGDSFFNIAETVAFKAEATALLADDISSGTPTLTSAALGQTHVLLADDIASGVPTLTSPVLAITHPLLAEDVAAGTPTLTSPAVGQVHALLADDVATGTPTLTTAVLGQVHALTADDIASGTPTLTVAALGQAHVLIGDAISSGTPTLGTPVLAQSGAVVVVAAPEGLGINRFGKRVKSRKIKYSDFENREDYATALAETLAESSLPIRSSDDEDDEILLQALTIYMANERRTH